MNISVIKKNNGYIFRYFEQDYEFEHCITFDESDIITNNHDALFMFSLHSRPKNADSYVFDDLIIKSNTLSNYTKKLNSKIICKTFESDITPNLNNLDHYNSYLLFSGGFDSVALRALIPESIRSLSIDFGDKFQREALFFRKFNTIVTKWDIREGNNNLKFNEKNDWRFLVSPALLLMKNDPIAILSGTIMEASPWHFFSKKKKMTEYDNAGFASSVNYLTPISCLTEYGTALVANEYLGNNVEDSLKSLAPKNSLKSYRKDLLLSIVNKYKTPIKNSKPFYSWNSYFADDILSLYFNFKFGPDWTRNNWCNNIPDEFDGLDFSFFEKINQSNLQLLDDTLHNYVLLNLKDYGLKTYNYNDICSFSDFYNMYKKYLK